MGKGLSGTAIVAALVLAALAARDGRAADGAWSDTIATEGSQPLVKIGSLRALPDGSMLVSGEPGRDYFARFDDRIVRIAADGSMATPALNPYLLAPSESLHAASALTGFVPLNNDLEGPRGDQACSVDRNWLGPLHLRLFDKSVLYRSSARALDAGGGHFGAYLAPGAEWYGPHTVVRFAPDCSRRVIVRAHPGTWTLYNIPNARAAYAVGFLLTRIEETGVAWSIQPTEIDPVSPPRFEAISSDGGALLLHSRRRGSGGNYVRDEVISIDPSGGRRWTWTTAGDEIRALESQSGWTYVLADSSIEGNGQSGDFRLQALDGGGRLAWSHDVGTSRPGVIQRGDPESPLVWSVSPRADDADRRVRVLRGGTDGVVEVVRTRLAPTVRLANGDFVAIEPAEGDGDDRLVRFSSSDGAETPVVPAVPRTVRIRDVLIDMQGSVVATQSAWERVTLTRWSDDGALLWRRDVAVPEGTVDDESWNEASLRLVANAHRVCIVQVFFDEYLLRHASCLRMNDGATIHGWVQVPSDDLHDAAVVRLAAADVLEFETYGCESSPCPPLTGRLDRIDAAGNLLLDDASTRFSGHVQASDGGYAVPHRFGSSINFVAVHRADGSQRWQATFELPISIAGLAEGGRLSVVDAQGVRTFAADGTIAWSTPWPNGGYFFRVSGVMLASGDVIVQGIASNEGIERRMRVRAHDGSIAWQHVGRSSLPAGREVAWTLSSDGSLAFTRPATCCGGDKLWMPGDRALSIDVDTGEFVGAVGAPEIASLGTRGVAISALRSDGALVRVAEDIARGDARVSFVPASTLSSRSALAVDASLLGLWQSDDTSGQGFYFDADTGGAGHYGAWFTYGISGGDVASSLRWYTLVAAPPADAGLPTFAIMSSSNARFARAPAAEVRQVGTATLRRLDCDRAYFAYRMKSDHAASAGASEGIVALHRATPRARDCAGSSGLPAVASHGLDPKSSGAWYNPAASGQGFAFELRPPLGADPGLFAGGWFTFDPTAVADDPTAQHWFTLAGDLAGAADGSLTVPIYRTLGGGFEVTPTDNTSRVGSATLRFQDCSHATLSYEFDESDLAQAFAGLHGTQSLVRIGGCGD